MAIDDSVALAVKAGKQVFARRTRASQSLW
jgi:hypothetical protein